MDCSIVHTKMEIKGLLYEFWIQKSMAITIFLIL